jgi:hypothetical protein
MVSRRSKLIIIIGLIIVLLLVGAGFIFFSKSSSNTTKILNPGYGAVADSQFKITTGWYQDLSTAYESSAKLKFNGSTGKAVLMVMVDQFPNESQYQQAYGELSQKPQWHIASQGAEVKEGISVKTITVARDAGGETVKYYFFQKNGKYYQILIDIAGTSDSTQVLSNYNLDETVNTVIRTIN